MTPHRLDGTDEAEQVLSLIQTAFAYMEGRIDPPSSMLRLTAAGLLDLNAAGEVWVIGAPPLACVVLTPKDGALYIGKLAVHPGERRKGLARALISHAQMRALALGLPALELQTRIELVENHLTFRAMGFFETARATHAGYDRPTTLTFRRDLT